MFCNPKWSRRKELQQWADQVRSERNAKTFETLTQYHENGDGTTAHPKPNFLSATETKEQILQGKLDIAQNVLAVCCYTSKHGRDQDRINAVTEEFYDDAYKRAKELEQTYNNDKQKIKDMILFGIPISIKDSIYMKGTYTTGGLACRLASKCDTDGFILQLIKNAGAIPICKGNTIQLMMLFESYNKIWGRSRNPWGLQRTCGGSSGGDAALVASGCVPIGIGSDIAGSARIPAAFCGIVGFKPTSTRFTYDGFLKPRRGDKQGTSIVIRATVGPMARTVDDCALFVKALCVPEMWNHDRSVPPLPFNEKEYNNSDRLRIGYFHTDGWFEPCVAAKRALNETIVALQAAGHTCIPFNPPKDGKALYGLLVSINAAEGRSRSFAEALEGEEFVSEYDTLRLAMSLPDPIRWIASKILDERRSYLLGCARRNGISVYELWQLTAALIDLRKLWSDAVVAASVDTILYPAFPLPALPHGMPGKLSASASYMFIANLLEWPCGVVPVTTILDHEQHYYDTNDAVIDGVLPKNQRDELSKLAGEAMKNSAGLPMGVMVMTTSFQDEKCLRVMKEVEGVVNFTAKPKGYF